VGLTGRTDGNEEGELDEEDDEEGEGVMGMGRWGAPPPFLPTPTQTGSPTRAHIHLPLDPLNPYDQITRVEFGIPPNPRTSM